jgi:hypothetical protein
VTYAFCFSPLAAEIYCNVHTPFVKKKFIVKISELVVKPVKIYNPRMAGRLLSDIPTNLCQANDHKWILYIKLTVALAVNPMSYMCLTSLQKWNWARWQMLFHPTALTLEFCNPLTFGQIHLSCAFCAFPGWNMTQKIHFLLHHWSIPPSPSMQYFILIGWKSPGLPGPDIVFRPVHKKSSVNLGKVRPVSQKHQCSVQFKGL